MKRLAPWILAAALLIPSLPRAAVIDEIVIKVNDSVVTKSEYEKRLKSTLEGMKREYKGPDLEVQIKQVPQRLLEQMEDELLLVEKAKQLYQVDMIVDSQVDGFMKDNKLATKADLAKALQAEGLTMDEFRKQLTLIYVPEFMASREIRSKISVSMDEVKAYYEAHKNELTSKAQVQLQEILILKKNHSLEEAQGILAEVRKEAAAGKDSGDLASKYSDAFSAGAKGSAGWFTPVDLSPAISKAVFSLKIGETTDLIPTDAGWYLFRVQDRKEAQAPSLEQAREQVVEAIKQEKYQKAYKQYVDDLKAQNYVRINPKYV
jgi:peptidyl-prolyl cis-trans isomerase SurA